MTDPLVTAMIGLVIGAGGGWLFRALYESRRNRNRLEARLYVSMVEHQGKPNRQVLRFEIANYAPRSVVIKALEIYVGKKETVDLESKYGPYDMPYNLQPGATLYYYVPADSLSASLLEAGAPRDARLRALFWDIEDHSYASGYSMTLRELARLR